MKALLSIAFLLAGQTPLVAQSLNGTIKGPAAAIHGKVVQPDGQPATGIGVELLTSAAVTKGTRILMPSGKPAEAGRGGEYRFSVTPGDYYVRTVSTPRMYFPNTPEPGEAKAIHVEQGDDISVDIQLSATPVFKISGRIIDLVSDPKPHSFSEVSFVSKSSAVREYKVVAAAGFCCGTSTVPDSNFKVSLSNDRFEIRGVRPGTYELTAVVHVSDSKPDQIVISKPGDRPPYSINYRGRTVVEVTSADVVDIKVEVRAVAFEGRIVSNSKSIQTKGISVTVSGPDHDLDGTIAIADKSGRFRFPNLLDGTYTLDPLILPLDAYFVEILQGGKRLSNSEFVFNKSNPQPIEIIVSPNGGVIDGQVFNSDRASILLVPADGQTRYDAVPIRRTSPFGEFMIRGVAPGQYRIFAFNNLPSAVSSGAVAASDFVRPYEAQGTPLIVKPGARTAVRLSVIQPAVK